MVESSYMKEAPKSSSIVCKIAGIDPLFDYHNNTGQILPHIKGYGPMWGVGGKFDQYPCFDKFPL